MFWDNLKIEKEKRKENGVTKKSFSISKTKNENLRNNTNIANSGNDIFSVFNDDIHGLSPQMQSLLQKAMLQKIDRLLLPFAFFVERSIKN